MEELLTASPIDGQKRHAIWLAERERTFISNLNEALSVGAGDGIQFVLDNDLYKITSTGLIGFRKFKIEYHPIMRNIKNNLIAKGFLLEEEICRWYGEKCIRWYVRWQRGDDIRRVDIRW